MEETKEVGRYKAQTLYITVYDSEDKVLKEQQLPLRNKSLRNLAGPNINNQIIYQLNKKRKCKLQFPDGYVIYEIK